MGLISFSLHSRIVAPFAGAWIEIFIEIKPHFTKPSLPSRERGLKSVDWSDIVQECEIVAPFAGAWIEIMSCRDRLNARSVAPFAGAWIEMGGGAGE